MFASGMISKLARYIHQIEGLQISYSVYLTCSSLKHDTFYYPTMNLQQRAYINYAFPPSFSHISLPTQSFYSPTYNDVPTSHNAHCHFSLIQCTCTPTSTPTGSPGQARQALSCFPAPLGGVPPPPTALPSSAPGAPAPTLPGRPDLAPPGISRPPDSNSLPASPPPAVPISSAAGAPAPTLFGRPDLAPPGIPPNSNSLPASPPPPGGVRPTPTSLLYTSLSMLTVGFPPPSTMPVVSPPASLPPAATGPALSPSVGRPPVPSDPVASHPALSPPSGPPPPASAPPPLVTPPGSPVTPSLPATSTMPPDSTSFSPPAVPAPSAPPSVPSFPSNGTLPVLHLQACSTENVCEDVKTVPNECRLLTTPLYVS
jgi:hypothetical protein